MMQDSRCLHGKASYRHPFGPASMHSPDLDSLTFSSDNISKVCSNFVSHVSRRNQGLIEHIKQTSCLNTPSTFPSEFPSDLLGGLPEQAPSQKIMSPYSKVKGWVHHTAMNAVGKKNKEQRACYNCFVRKQAVGDGFRILHLERQASGHDSQHLIRLACEESLID